MECTQEWYYKEINRLFAEIIPQKMQSQVRPGQVDMALAVAEALWEGHKLAVEAGTGVGKSLAYLIPAALWRLQGGENAPVISTKTINLQGQLMRKDVPFVLELLKEQYGASLRVTEALGMTNYICRRRLAFALKQRQELTSAQRTMLDRVAAVVTRIDDRYSLFAAEEDPEAADLAGTKSECNVDAATWALVRCDKWMCPKKRCPFYNDCFLYQNRRNLFTAHIIVANHSLVLADASLRRDGASGLLPSQEILIFDEAHHIEDVATQQLSYKFMRGECLQILNKVQNSEERPGEESLLTRLHMAINEGRDLPNHSAWISVLDRLEYGCLDNLRDELFQLFDRLRDTFSVSLGQNGGKMTLDQRMLDDAGEYGISLGEEAQRVLSRLQSCADLLSEAEHLAKAGEDNALQELSEDIALAREQVVYLREALQHSLDIEDEIWINWVETIRYARPRLGQETEYIDVGLKSALLHIGPSLNEYLFKNARSLILASATLKIRNKMDFFLHSIGLSLPSATENEKEAIKTLSCDSPFDYRRQALLAVATDLPDYLTKSAAGWIQTGLIEPLADLITALQGRTLMLFTSNASLQFMGELLSQRLLSSGIRVLIQGQGERSALAHTFSTEPKCLLLGADSFWEGIDVKGDALQCVIVFKLPFVSPEEPIHKARIASVEEKGGNPFLEYQIPLAITKLRQGMGRLIRSTEDRGVVLILDSRLETKYYGRNIINSLPPFTCQRGPLKELVENSLAWIGIPRLQREFVF
ncbi:MAG: ATP-dependent DNA helicase [bacterium]|nr:ATP-dependent DNA helicase [bacterium]